VITADAERDGGDHKRDEYDIEPRSAGQASKDEQGKVE
jgi:hypothetical protein